MVTSELKRNFDVANIERVRVQSATNIALPKAALDETLPWRSDEPVSPLQSRLMFETDVPMFSC